MSTETTTPVSPEMMSLLCGNDKIVLWQQRPFYAVKWNAATNAHIMVGYLGEPDYEPLEKESVSVRVDEYLSGTFERLVRNTGALRASELIEAFDNWPRVSEMDCMSCFGGEGDDGEECKVCGGVGELHAAEGDDQFRDPNAQVLIEGVGHFKTFTWHKLGPLLKGIGADELRITHGSANTMLRLEVVGTPIVIGLMPVMQVDGPADDRTFRTITPVR